MISRIRKVLFRLVRREHTVRAGEGERWALWVKWPWHRPGSFSGQMFSVRLEVECSSRLAWRRKAGIRGGRGFMLCVDFGNAAGYRWGRSLWVGRHWKGRGGVGMYRVNPRMRAGFGPGMIPGWWS